MRLVVGAATDVGRVREGNEDGYLVDDSVGLVALADGMGGHLGGEVASATALEALRASVRAGRPLRDAVADANDAVFAKARTDASLTGMGTTLTAGTLAAGGTLILVHVGDSRAYLLREGVLRRVTTDHSHVQELVDDGQLTDDEAAVHPMRNIVTRALGIDATVDVDVYPVELQVDDRVLLCSDGLTDMVHEDAIAAELRREPDPTVAAHKLVDQANAAGGVDNITVVVVAVSSGASASTDGSVDGSSVELAPSVPAMAAEALLVDEPERGTATRDRAPEDPGRRSRRVKTALWVVAVVVVLGVAVGAVAWYARNSYYVAFDGNAVTVYKGVPGGLLVWDPTVERRTTLTRSDLRSADASAVADEKTFSSLDDANAFVARLRAHADEAATTTTRPAPSTTTVPPSTAEPTTSIAPGP
ncbi:MAG TPA: Stp1/IreP family PP2C-type Ser/Thr phosphatase [Acidimicrobiia bacterium]|nr:Stp1/IreP family PP2C-type Ser/Thr phosphatase [Acidimicrobiia bacterium]